LKTVIYATAVSIAAVSTAFAGSYTAPVVEPVMTAPVAVVDRGVDWTGFYAGLQYGTGDLEARFGGTTFDLGDYDGYGLHAGYLHDLGQWVLGGELSYDRVSPDGIPDSADLIRLRARAGFDLGRFQPYATVGGARLSYNGLSETGVTYGIGGEYLVTDRFSLGAEYSRVHFNDVQGTGADLRAGLLQLRGSFRF